MSHGVNALQSWVENANAVYLFGRISKHADLELARFLMTVAQPRSEDVRTTPLTRIRLIAARYGGWSITSERRIDLVFTKPERLLRDWECFALYLEEESQLMTFRKGEGDCWLGKLITLTAQPEITEFQAQTRVSFSRLVSTTVSRELLVREERQRVHLAFDLLLGK